MARIRIIIILAALYFPAYAIAADIRITPEKLMPAISYSDINGKLQTLDFSKNKLTALHFWATWCQPCAIELPIVNAMQQKYPKQGLKIMALSLDGKNIDNVKKFYSENNITSLDILMDANMDSFQKLKLKGLPTTIFINSKGHEIARAEGPLDWESAGVKKFIDERLK